MQRKDKAIHLEVSAILYKYDPMEVGVDITDDEYDIEAATILSRLHTAKNEEDVIDIVHEEFQSWFGKEAAGKRDIYEKIGHEIWEVYQRLCQKRQTLSS